MAAAVVPALFVLAGCGGSSSGGQNDTFSVSPGTANIDTNCTGCNNTNSSGGAVEQLTATLSTGSAAPVTWSVSGGDANSGAGSITSNGQYSPPLYLTANSVQVTVTATLTSGSGAGSKQSATVTVTPGFLEPLSPENAAVGASGQVNITGYIAEAGGSTGINYTMSSSATGSSGGVGSVGSPNCVRSSNAFTHCSVTYTAPSAVTSATTTYVVGTVGSSSSKTATELLINTAGISSNPTSHQVPLGPALLGSSGGSNNDYDTVVQEWEDLYYGLLRRHARRVDPEQQRHAVPAQL